MTAVIQRVCGARVSADGAFCGEIGKGLYILLGVMRGDSEKDADLLAAKIGKLRVFSDDNGKMNLALPDVGGAVMVVSNFTLAAHYAHGNRPDYLAAEEPERANALYEYFVGKMRESVASVKTGVFGADMRAELITDGPVTIVMHSEILKTGRKTEK